MLIPILSNPTYVNPLKVNYFQKYNFKALLMNLHVTWFTEYL